MTLPATHWSLIEKVTFRFVGFYLSLYTLFVIIGFIPVVDKLETYATLPWDVIVAWVSEKVLLYC